MTPQEMYQTCDKAAKATVNDFNEEAKRIWNHVSYELEFDPAMEIMACVIMLQEIMKSDVAHFKYTKKSDGSLREAYGTRCPEIIEQMASVSSNSSKKKKETTLDVFTYFDLEKNDWRSLKAINLVNIDTDYVE